MLWAADLYGLSNDFPCVTQYTNEYGVPDPTAPGFPFCSAAWSKRKGTLVPSLAHAPPQGMQGGRSMVVDCFLTTNLVPSSHMTFPHGRKPAVLLASHSHTALVCSSLELNPPSGRLYLTVSLTPPRLGVRLRQTRGGWHRMLLPRLLERVRAHAQAALRLHWRARRAAVLLSVAS